MASCLGQASLKQQILYAASNLHWLVPPKTGQGGTTCELLIGLYYINVIGRYQKTPEEAHVKIEDDVTRAWDQTWKP